VVYSKVPSQCLLEGLRKTIKIVGLGNFSLGQDLTLKTLKASEDQFVSLFHPRVTWHHYRYPLKVCGNSCVVISRSVQILGPRWPGWPNFVWWHHLIFEVAVGFLQNLCTPDYKNVIFNIVHCLRQIVGNVLHNILAFFSGTNSM
jgi:hypothetical protein